jgi:hypothetical protein
MFQLVGGPFHGTRAEDYGTSGVSIPIPGTHLYAYYDRRDGAYYYAHSATLAGWREMMIDRIQRSQVVD